MFFNVRTTEAPGHLDVGDVIENWRERIGKFERKAICWCAPQDFKFGHFTSLFHTKSTKMKHTERAEITGVAHSCCRRSLTTLGASEITVKRGRKLHLT